MTTSEDYTATNNAKSTEDHLDFLDGLRAVAALYIVLFHLRMEGLPNLWKTMMGWIGYSNFAVDVFIVLSGFCLMLPVARSGSKKLRGGFRGYMFRRARRIMPPYYAALALTSLLILFSWFIKRHSPGAGAALSALSLPSVLSHLFLVHNLSREYIQTIDPPMWSVATEWQIYFLLPLVLLPAYRKAGLLSAVIVAFTLGLLPHFLLPKGYNYDWAHPWFLGLFALGMAGAVLFVNKTSASHQRIDRRIFAWLSAILFALAYISANSMPHANVIIGWAIDTMVGGATISLIIYCALSSFWCDKNRQPLILRFLESKQMIKIGAFSYSLYLIHFPVLWVLQPFVRKLHLGLPQEMLFRIMVILPLMLMIAYFFHLIFEKRFQSSQISKSITNSHSD